MHIQSIQVNTNSYSQKKRDINFKNIYNPKLIFNRVNPFIQYVDNQYKRSVTASRRIWSKPHKDIENLVTEVNIKLNKKKNKNIIAWDINNPKNNDNRYVLILHGLSHNITSLQALYKAVINNTNFSILAPEYQGLNKEDTNTIYMNPVSLTNDVDSAIDFLKQKGVEEHRIFLLGHSFGGYIATKTASKNDKLGGLILVSTINSLAFESKGFDEKNADSTSKSIMKVIKKHNIGQKFFSNMLKIDTLFKKTNIPIDIIHSQNDRLIPIKSVEKALNNCAKLNSFNILQTGSHKMDNEKIDTIVRLLNSKLN